jgi:hypothetical protein
MKIKPATTGKFLSSAICGVEAGLGSVLAAGPASDIVWLLFGGLAIDHLLALRARLQPRRN